MKGVFIAAVPLLAALSSASPFTVDTIHNNAAPLVSSVNAKDIPNSYIIVFKKHVNHEAATAHHSWVEDVHFDSENQKLELKKRGLFPNEDTIFGGLKHTFNIGSELLGYSGHFDDSVIETIRRHPDVSHLAFTQ